MDSDTESARPTPKAFVSYSWDSEVHKQWVLGLATRLRTDGVDVTLDQWHLQPGDQLPAFMEGAVRENDYVLIVCTPLYADRSNRRIGGVGYEGDIMTGDVFTTRNERKFIPIYRSGSDWHSAAPSWLMGKYRVDLRGETFSEEQYRDLLTTLHGTRPIAPPVTRRSAPPSSADSVTTHLEPRSFEPLRILGALVDQVTAPRNDGTRGSALYRIPFQLSRRPSSHWASVFVQKWDRPSSFTTSHRPGIASVVGDKVYLDGTTIEEVEKTHRSTLILALQETNRVIEEHERQTLLREQEEGQRRQEHERSLRDTAKRITFD